jgi:hypothetical protein
VPFWENTKQGDEKKGNVKEVGRSTNDERKIEYL